MYFKINIRNLNQSYQLHVKLLHTDKIKEQWQVWNNAINIIVESNRPFYRNRIGLKRWKPRWKLISGEIKPHSLLDAIGEKINEGFEQH